MDALVVKARDEGVEQELGRRLVGIADAEVDNVLSGLLERGALALELGKEIRREFLEAIQPKPDALPALQRAAEGTTHDGH